MLQQLLHLSTTGEEDSIEEGDGCKGGSHALEEATRALLCYCLHVEATHFNGLNCGCRSSPLLLKRPPCDRDKITKWGAFLANTPLSLSQLTQDVGKTDKSDYILAGNESLMVC